MASSNPPIAPADGKLGILIPGIGAVATTFIAGVELVRRGQAQPVGSLTQLATIRLGKRTEGKSPYIRDFVPLAKLDDLAFGGWDIYEDNAFEAASNARVLDQPQLEQVKDFLSGIKPMKAVFDQNYVKRILGTTEDYRRLYGVTTTTRAVTMQGPIGAKVSRDFIWKKVLPAGGRPRAEPSMKFM